MIRDLRLGSAAQINLSLRKLRIRWWHASAASMTRLLERAGVPKAALGVIPSITQTCNVRRKRARPLPQSIASAELPESFSKQVEADLVFVMKCIVFHIVDTCTRWYHAILINGKTEDDLIGGVDSRVRVHTPPPPRGIDHGLRNGNVPLWQGA